MNSVADTLPLCCLILIREIGLLPKLFDQVLVPAVVIAELLHDDAPDTVRSWAANLPSWASVRENPALNFVGSKKLQAGEQATILLAESTNANVILLDEKSARRIAEGRGLRVTGTLGVLAEAATRGLVDLARAIDGLRKTYFRYSPALLKVTLGRFSSR
jgi:predicted nucleic acid-binding protein